MQKEKWITFVMSAGIVALAATLMFGCGTQDWDDVERSARAYTLPYGTFDCTGAGEPTASQLYIYRANSYFETVNFNTAPCIGMSANTNMNDWSGYTWPDNVLFNGHPIAWRAKRQPGSTQVVYFSHYTGDPYYLHYDSTSTQVLNVPGSSGFGVGFVSNSRY